MGDNPRRGINKFKIALLISVLFLIVGVILFVVFIAISKPSTVSGGGGDDGSFNWIPFFPVWIAALIPIFTNKQQKSELTSGQRTLLFVVLGITVAAVLGTLLIVLL